MTKATELRDRIMDFHAPSYEASLRQGSLSTLLDEYREAVVDETCKGIADSFRRSGQGWTAYDALDETIKDWRMGCG